MNRQPKNIEAIYPLSPMQEGLLFHTLLEESSGMYFEQFSCSIEGELCPAAFRKAWEQVVARHPILRTLFLWKNRNKPLQVVRPSVSLPWLELDWRALTVAERQSRLDQLLGEDRQKGFELGLAPLMRCSLIFHSPTESVFVWSHHHLLLDGWSTPIVLKEVFAFYEAYRQGRDLHLPAVAPYRDYITWLQRQDAVAAEVFWRENLQGFAEPTPLQDGRDKVYGSGDLPLQEETVLWLSPSTSGDLNQLAQQNRLTLNTIVNAAWGLVLNAWSGRSDVLFGATVSGRPTDLPGVESMVGLFINALPVRIQVSRGARLIPWLQTLQIQNADRERFSYAPLASIQGWSAVSRSVPFFDSLLVFENYPVERGVKRGESSLTITGIRGFERTNYPLIVEVMPGDRVWLRMRNDPARLATATMHRIMDHFQRLLREIARDPSRRLWQFDPLHEEERLRLLVKWNRSVEGLPMGSDYYRLWKTRVEVNPDALAVTFGGAQSSRTTGEKHLSYRQIDCMAERMARHFLGYGIGPGSLIPLLAERSPEFLAAVLAIFKNGCAYLPLDPHHPPRRLVGMMRQSGAAWLLFGVSFAKVARRVTGLLPESGKLHCLGLAALLAQQPAMAATVSQLSHANQLAYVVFTSGSTGKPKGAMVARAGMINHLYAKIDALQISAADIVAQNASQCFDISIWQFLAAFLRGGRIHIFTDEEAHDPRALLQRVGRHRLTILEVVPSFLRMMLEELRASKNHGHDLSALRWLVPTGEALPPELCGRWLRELPMARLLNAYGPTECSDDVTHFTLVRPPPEQAAHIPIGNAIANTRLFILDPWLRLAPGGVAGELHVSGIAVGQGYLNDPQRTAAAFIPNPYATRWSNSYCDDRLYKTGDLVRYLSDAKVEFLGRNDHQVKIRGFRIELAEVRSVLERYPGVRESVVVDYQEASGGKKMLAYFCLERVESGARPPSSADLRDFMTEQLPDYMIPSAFVMLESFPLTPNGKLDRGALPLPDTHAENESDPAPETPVQEILAGIWAEILELPRVGSRVSFFDLGGHSLLATRVISRVRNAFSVDLPLRALFEAPTVAGLGARIEAARREGRVPSLPPLQKVSRSGPMPLSFGQQRLWFLDRLEGPGAAYNTPVALRLTGLLDIGALEGALGEMVRRHESIRTSFPEIEGQPVQRFHDPERIFLPVVVLPSACLEASLKEAVALANREGARPFDLGRGPLWRATLVVLDRTNSVLMLTLHHIVSDGWSLAVMVQELVALYRAFSQQRPSPLAEPEIQYADFAHWQHQWLSGAVLENQIAFWKRHLAGAPALLNLPTDRPRPSEQRFHGDNEPFFADLNLLRSIRRVNETSRTTLFMTLLTAFQLLLAKYSGQDDVVVGTPIANRTQKEVETLIGLFVNTLALRARCHGDLGFRELLRRVRETSLEAYDHQDLPFEKLVEELQPERDLGHSPLFQVMFILQNNPSGEVVLPKLTLAPLGREAHTAKFDITLTIMESDEGLAGFFEYRTDLFERATIHAMADHFGNLLRAATDRPDLPASGLSLMSEGEKTRVLEDWNRTEVSFPPSKTLTVMFAEQLARTPDGVALHIPPGDRPAMVPPRPPAFLSYGALNARSDRIARRLAGLGVALETPVAVCLQRSSDWVTAMLGILKAGGAYVPLAPAFPRQRLRFILADAGARVVLTHTRLASRLEDSGPMIIALDREWHRAPGESSAYSSKVSLCADPDLLAYILYTSGSTGRPKGVQGPHGSIINRVYWMWRAYPFHERDICCFKTSPTFVDSVWETFGPLLRGVVNVVMDEDLPKEAPALIRELARCMVTRLAVVPTLLRSMLENDSQLGKELPRLTHWICSGETLSTELLERFRVAVAGVSPLNLYGSAEVSADATFYPTSRGIQPHGVPIGQPIANVRTHVLTPALRPVPPGVYGEILVGGAALARGYIGRVRQTAASFLPNPFAREGAVGSRLYRTGDMGRFLSSGDLEYLGRRDRQVKIRGMRVEPGEIEFVLCGYEPVREAVVVAHPAGTGGMRLSAYLTSSHKNRAKPLHSQAMREWLEPRLPDYMIPTSFVVLKRFPLNSSGKIDRLSLPRPGQPSAEGIFKAARNPTEELLSAIWAEVLKLDRVGVLHNFFELGGHSLLATRIFSRIRTAFGLDLPPRVLFENPTIAGLGAKIENARGRSRRAQAPPLEAVVRSRRLPLSFSQQRLWFLDRLEGPSPVYNMPAALRLRGWFDSMALEQSVMEIVRRHESLRTRFQEEDGKAVQKIDPSGSVRLRLINLAGLPREMPEKLAQSFINQVAQRPFDLERGPLLRVLLCRLEPREHVLVMNIHHIVSDGWSMEVFVREWMVLYACYSAERPSPLVPLAIQYADFACWQQRWLRGKLLEAQLDYWKKQLEGIPEFLELPADRPRPMVRTFNGASVGFRIEEDLSLGVHRLCRHAGVTSFMCLQAVFAILLARYSGQDELVIGTPIANRNREELEPLIGFFANSLALRTLFTAGLDFNELLERTRKTALDAYEHQDLPFERLVEALQPERNLAQSPVFQIMFVLQNDAGDERPPLPGLTLTPVALQHAVARFDLTLWLREAGGRLLGYFEYNTDLFDRGTIERMAGHFKRLLAAVRSEPQRAVFDLPLLSTEERQRMLAEWNASGSRDLPELCVHERFEVRSRQTPEAVALVFKRRMLTYRELNRRAGLLAAVLRPLGVGADRLVAAYFDRVPETIVALLGILKACGAYVPLDPAYPSSRLVMMLEDMDASVMVTRRGLLEGMAACQLEKVVLHEDGGLPRVVAGGLRSAAGGRPPAPNNLAYLIFTSGSSGRPKGVMATHHNLINQLHWRQTTFRLLPAHRVLQSISLSFDPSVWQIFWPLTRGAALVLPAEEIQRDSAAMVAMMAAHYIAVTAMVPSFLRVLLNESALAACHALHHISCGGEPLGMDLQLKFWEVTGLRRVLHVVYGPTEATIDATYRLGVPGPEHVIHIGKPVTNTRLYILDTLQRPVPVGVAGELFIGGTGITRGYFRQPALTAARFIPNPFPHPDAPQNKGERLYRTGDLARYLAGGSIEFLGRLDQQVKIRGFRIELGEIEAVLERHPSVNKAVLAVDTDARGHRRLAAYVRLSRAIVAQPDSAPALFDEWRDFLKNRLPAHMVPAAFRILATFPLTPNGKLDRKALPEPDGGPGQTGRPFEPPRTRAEEVLAAIWARLLALERVGIHDNFFDLGGDSILSIQIIAKARQEGLHLTPKQLFEHQTIAELAPLARVTANPIQAEQEAVVGRLPLTPIQHWFFELELSQRQHFNQAVMLETPPGLDPVPLERALAHLIEHHDALRLRFRTRGGEILQENAPPGGTCPFHVFDLGGLAETMRPRALRSLTASMQTSLHLERGPLLRMALFLAPNGREPESGRLTIVMHHLVVDGLSWRIFLEDLQSAYFQLEQRRPPTLPSKTTSFKFWAHRLARFGQSGSLAGEVDYWLSQTEEAKNAGPIPFKGGSLGLARNTVASAKTLTRALSVRDTRALLHESPAVYKTRINDLLLTALAMSFHQWTDASELRVDLEGHGREDLFEEVDLSRTMGWFTSIYPVNLHLSGTAGKEDLAMWIKEIKERLRAIPRHGVGYGILAYLHPDRETRARLSRGVRAAVSFNYLGQVERGVTETGLFKLAPEPCGPLHGADLKRLYLLEINGFVGADQLRMSWTYCAHLHDEATVAELAESFNAHLRLLVHHCLNSQNGGYTPSDFPLAGIGQPTLDRITAGQKGIEDIYPLAPMQEGLLFHTLLEAASESYFQQLSIKLIGPLRLASLQRAWRMVLARHAILRTRFCWQDLAEPLQLVQHEVELPWRSIDLRNCSATQQKRLIEDYRRADRARGFELDKAPLMRLALFQLENDSHLLVWSHHHLLTDGWSMPRILQEAFGFYEPLAAGRKPEQRPVRPFRDYIAWLKGQDMRKAEDFWKYGFQDFTSPTPLPADRGPRADGGSVGKFETREVRLDAAASRRLQQLARTHRLTLNTLCLGAWALVLGRYAHEPEVVFGFTLNGRPPTLEGAAGMVGLFINTLPVRCEMSPARPLIPWLRGLQEQQLEREQYAFTPLAKIQRWSGIPRGGSLFECLFVFENYPVGEAVAEGARASLKVAGIGIVEHTHYPLTLTLTPAAELSLEISYDTRRFADETIHRVLDHYRNLLAETAADPERNLGLLSMMDAEERRRVLHAWNQTQSELPLSRCFPRLFEERAERLTEAVAMSFENACLSYGDLNRRANALALSLIGLGVGPESIIPVFAARGFELAIAILGVFKAGAAYLPLDPFHPPRRHTRILQQTGPTLILTTRESESGLHKVPALLERGFRIRFIASYSDPIMASLTNPGLRYTAENLAYLIFTSGSTGRPKGVMVTHKGMLNHLFAKVRDLGLGPADIVAQNAPQSFDISVWQFWAASLVGGKVVIFADEASRAPRPLLALANASGLTVLEVVPSLLGGMLEEIQFHAMALGRLRWLVATGEALAPDLYFRWREMYPRIPLLNAYGPTECSDDVSHFPIHQLAGDTRNMPIGRPVVNTTLYILGYRLLPRAAGVVGELFVGGVGVGRGYHQNPARTARSFIADPYAAEPGQRLYRTGDLARFLCDGDIEFLGRVDDQVKIRGFRIELGEIASVLAAHAKVAEAVAAVREDRPGDQRLVAYIRLREDAAEEAELGRALKIHLASELPVYMVPGHFVFLERMPLTTSGKLDRKALPAPDSPADSRPFVAPRNEWEWKLAAVWEEILGFAPVGVVDNFFELGGHSLMAVRMMTRVQQVLGVELPLAALFREPTIQQIAASLKRASEDLSPTPLVPIRAEGDLAPFFCVHPAGGNVFCYQELSRCLGTRQPFFGLRSPTLYGDLSHGSIEALADHYIEAMRAVRPRGPYHIGGWSLGGLIAFEMAAQLERRGEEVGLLALFDTYPPDENSMRRERESDTELLVSLAKEMSGLRGKTLAIDADLLRPLPEEEQLRLLLEMAVATELLPPDMALHELQKLWDVYKLNFHATIRYQPSNYTGPLDFFAAETKLDETEPDPLASWRELTPTEITVHRIPGHHHSMIQPPQVDKLAQCLAKRMQAPARVEEQVPL